MYSATNRSGRPIPQLRSLSCRDSWTFKWRDRCRLYHRRPIPAISLQGRLLQRAVGWEAGFYYFQPWSYDVGEFGRVRDSRSP